MDEHDWQIANPNKGGGNSVNYIIIGLLVVGIAAAAYYNFKLRK
jgi:hypothetical protein